MNKNLIAFSLREPINCEVICSQIQQLINSHVRNNKDLSNSLLVISINPSTEYNKNLSLRIGINNE
jgi:hypothetical protein